MGRVFAFSVKGFFLGNRPQKGPQRGQRHSLRRQDSTSCLALRSCFRTLRVKFTYTKTPALDPLTKEKSAIYRPLIPIDLKADSKWFSEEYGSYLDALIDSRADRNIAPLEIAELLQIDLSGIDPIETRGIEGGSVETFYTVLSFKIGGHSYDAPMGFGKSFPMILLGGSGFFDNWKINLDYPKDFELKRK